MKQEKSVIKGFLGWLKQKEYRTWAVIWIALAYGFVTFLSLDLTNTLFSILGVLIGGFFIMFVYYLIKIYKDSDK